MYFIIYASASCHKNKIFGKYVYKYIIILININQSINKVKNYVKISN